MDLLTKYRYSEVAGWSTNVPKVKLLTKEANGSLQRNHGKTTLFGSVNPWNGELVRGIRSKILVQNINLGTHGNIGQRLLRLEMSGLLKVKSIGQLFPLWEPKGVGTISLVYKHRAAVVSRSQEQILWVTSQCSLLSLPAGIRGP